MDVAVTYSLIREYFLLQCVTYPIAHNIWKFSGADPCSTLGGIIPHFYRFFGILKFWGGYSGFADFSSFNDFENLGYIQVLTKMYLNN